MLNISEISLVLCTPKFTDISITFDEYIWDSPQIPSIYDIAVVTWITSCHKNRMAIRIITLWRVHVTSVATSASTVRFLIDIMFIFKAIISHFKGSYDKQNLTRMVVAYGIY